MDFTENIITYYTSEANHGLYHAALCGAVVLIGSIVLYFASHSKT